jgi:hypothetical protein
MRACAAIAPIHLGHFLPDYTAYEELLDVFRRFLPIPILLDPKLALSREMGVLGLPVSVILDPEGREIARMSGDAEWNSDSARAIIGALLKPE